MVVYSGAVPVVGPRAPYITPDILRTMPTGISWDTIPDIGSDEEERQAVLLDICQQATAEAEGITTQPLRATIDTEDVYGPGFRLTINQHTGIASVLLSRSPVTDIVSVQVSAASAFPPSWVVLPAGQYRVKMPLMGVYNTAAPGAAGDSGGPTILLAPGYVTNAYGEDGTLVEATYTNGWPHAAITEAASTNDSTLTVDDCTGWYNATAKSGAVAILDSGTAQEVVTISAASATSGPGTLTLATPLLNNHPVGVLVTTLPAAVRQACIYLAVAQALVRGATATTVQTIAPGGAGGGVLDPEHLVTEAEVLLHPFRRIL